MLVYAPGWILASQLQLILKLYPLFSKVAAFPRPLTKILRTNGCFRSKVSSGQNCGGVLGENVVTPISTLANNK